MQFRWRQGRTILYRCDQQPPLKVIRPFPLPDGSALIHLHNVSGGVLTGDQLELAAQLEEGARVQLTTTSATRVYRTRPDGDTALQINDLHVGQSALLEYLPDPLIPYAGARYEQRTNITLDEGAGLFWWETVTPGREAYGELFNYDMLRLQVDLSVQGRPIALERIKLEPGQQRINSLARLGQYRFFSTFYICKADVDSQSWQKLETTLAELAQQLSTVGSIVWGVSTLPAHGLVVRALSISGRDIPAGLLAFWQLAKRELYGVEAIPPRKVY